MHGRFLGWSATEFSLYINSDSIQRSHLFSFEQGQFQRIKRTRDGKGIVKHRDNFKSTSSIKSNSTMAVNIEVSAMCKNSIVQ